MILYWWLDYMLVNHRLMKLPLPWTCKQIACCPQVRNAILFLQFSSQVNHLIQILVGFFQILALWSNVPVNIKCHKHLMVKIRSIDGFYGQAK